MASGSSVPPEMSAVPSALLGVGVGAAFGFALESSKVNVPAVVTGQFLLEDFTVLRMYLSALFTSSFSIGSLVASFGISTDPKPLVPTANILGGLMAGAGLALSGTCPSTIFAQLGAKRPEALYALLGGLTGTALYVYSYPKLWEKRLAEDNRGTLQLSEVVGVGYATGAFSLSVLTYGAMLLLISKRRLWFREPYMAYLEEKYGSAKFWGHLTWTPDSCGNLYGLLQIPCFLLMRTYFGVSAAFVTAVCHACSLIDKDLFTKNKYATKFRSGSVVTFELLIHIGSFLGARLTAQLAGSLGWDSAPLSPGKRLQVFLGSALLLYGMRLAGGCTSGHAVSGVSQLSIGSMLATLCFIIGGVPTAMLAKRFLE